MVRNLYVHPLATASWESLPAATVRLHSRSIWARPLANETGAPERRIIHVRAAFADTPMLLDSVTFPVGAGYHKCASGQEIDAALHARFWIPDSDSWSLVGEMIRDKESALSASTTIPLSSLKSTAFVTEIRQAATDRWWPGWNLAATGIELAGVAPAEWQPRREGNLHVGNLDLSHVPPGVQADHRNSEVRFTTPYLSVGFRLRSPAWSYFSVDGDGTGRHSRSLLQQPRSMDIVRSGVYPSGVYPVLRDQNADYLAQGPRFTSHTGDKAVGFLASDYTGTTTVRGNVVRYDVTIPSAGQHYSYEFTIELDRITVRLSRESAAPARAWSSSAWHVATDNRVTPSTVLGRLVEIGETGLISGDTLWHFPRYGTIALSTDTDDVLVRSDSVRALDTNTCELKIGEVPTEFGDYLLPAGKFTATVTMRVDTPSIATIAEEAPAAVSRMLNRHALTALPFRTDTATYSNNGASMHCTTTLSDISAIAERLDALPNGMHPMELVGVSLSRWLDGAPSYGSGSTSHGNHRLEDEYVHMAGNTLAAVGRYLTWSGNDAWFARHQTTIVQEIENMLARDVDDDGIVESTLRRGVSGEHQWSTSWADVISFGWKDAWANAVVFEAWHELAPALVRFGEAELADRVVAASTRLQESYLPTFFNESTGLVAGWRSADGELHDYGFSLVNGAACAGDLLPIGVASSIMGRLLGHWNDVGLKDLRNGIPLNLWRIPERDIGGVIFGLPMGSYQQGGCSHHGARVIVDALARAGFDAEADSLLTDLATTIADDSSFGGLGSGLDWRAWDGTPSGYEGQLAEGFSILASALRRYS
jgi:hypothetical protein